MGPDFNLNTEKKHKKLTEGMGDKCEKKGGGGGHLFASNHYPTAREGGVPKL